MKQLLMRMTSGEMEPQALRRSIQESNSPEMSARRAIVGVSLVGIASMAIVSLYQMGAARHLPDPPVRRPHFHSDKVNASTEAFGYGMPDGPLTIGAHAANIMLAAAGPDDRSRQRPWLPLLASLLSGLQAAVAAKYLFYTMPKVDKAWCPYCIADALTHFATFALTLPEAQKAIVRKRSDWIG
jgi:uncharacterized membrane protein